MFRGALIGLLNNPMTVLIILGLLTVGSAIAAISMRNLVHCALALTGSFAGLSGLYLQLGAQFVGFAQVLIYIGAVAILIVFAILLTQGSTVPTRRLFSSTWFWGAGIGVLSFLVLAKAILKSTATGTIRATVSPASVQDIGTALMTQYLLPLEVLGLLLTAALLGAVMIAMREQAKSWDKNPSNQ